jgi:hypothetical protein
MLTYCHTLVDKYKDVRYQNFYSICNGNSWISSHIELKAAAHFSASSS